MDYEFFNACYCKDTEIILKKIEKGANDWNYGLQGACLGGRIDIANLIIEKASEHIGSEEIDWNTCLFFACKGGYIDMINFVIQKGANCWNAGLVGACQRGHMNIVLLMIKKASEECGEGIDWNHGLERAYYDKQYDIAQLMIEKGADPKKLHMHMHNYEAYVKYIKEKNEKKELIDKMNINDCAHIVHGYL